LGLLSAFFDGMTHQFGIQFPPPDLDEWMAGWW